MGKHRLDEVGHAIGLRKGEQWISSPESIPEGIHGIVFPSFGCFNSTGTVAGAIAAVGI